MSGPIRIAILADARQAQAAFLKVGASAEGMGAKIARTGSRLTRSLTLPLVAIAGASVKMSTDFNASMTRIQTQAGASAQDVKTLSKQVLDLAANSQQGPVELADSLFHLKSVGLDNVKAMKALTEATKLAAVGGADLEETTNAVAGAWRTGIHGAGNFSHTVATLNAIIGAGNQRMEDLNAALGTGFLPSAKTFGLSLQDVGSALALFTDEGIPAEVAATRLRMSFSLLGAPSEKAEKVLSGIALSGDQLAHALRDNGLVGAIGLLKEHLQGLSKVEQAQTLSRAFGGGRSSSAILGLINNFDVLKQKEKQVTDGINKFGEDAKKQAETPQAQFKLLLSTLEVLAIKIGDELLPDVIRLADGLNDMLTWVSKLPAPVKAVAGGFAGVAAVIGPLLLLSGALVRSYTAVSAAMTATSEAAIGTRIQLAGLSIMQNRLRFAGAIAGMAALTASTKTSNGALSGLLQVSGGIATGFAAGGPLGAAIGGAVGAFTVLTQHMHSASEEAKQSRANYDGLKGTLDDLTGAVTTDTRKFVENQLARSGTLKNLATYGITTRTAISAILGEGRARQTVTNAIHAQSENYKGLLAQIKQIRDQDVADQKAGTLDPETFARRKALVDQLQKQADAEKTVIDAVRDGIGITRKDIQQKRAEIAATADYSGKLRGLPKSLVTYIKANGVVPTTKVVAALAKQYDLTPKQINTLITATGIDATVKQVKRVEDGLTDVNKVRPDLSAYQSVLRNQLDQAGGIARSGGVQIGNALGSGLSSAVRGWTGSIARDSADLVSNAILAARTAADAHSPSRKMIQLGNDMAQGLSIGLRSDPAVKVFASMTGNGAARVVLDQPRRHSGRPVQITVQAPVGADAYTIGEQLKGYLDTYLDGLPA